MHASRRRAAVVARAPFAISACAAALGSLFHTAAYAQDSAITPSVTDKTQQIVVTANKRVEDLEQVPEAITVLDRHTLERNHVRELADVVNLSPALTITYGTTPANNGINMRGIGTTSIGVGVEADVAVIIDDIPIGMQVRAFQDLVDIDRVEILKGPQSTLFGKSAIAGAINITTRPISGPVRTSTSTLYTSDGEWRLGVANGGEVSDRFGYRLVASKTRFPGNVDNLTYGDKTNGSGGSTYMAKLQWHLTDPLDVELSPRYDHSVVTCCALVPTKFVPIQGALLANIAQLPATSLLQGITPGPDNTAIRNDYSTGQESTTRGTGLKISYALPGGATLSSISSINRYYADDFRDQDFVDAQTLLYYPLSNGKPAGVNAGYVQYGTFDVISQTQEFRFVSSPHNRLRYVAGYWYGKNTIERHFVRGYNGVALTSPAQFFADTSNTTHALFGQATYDLTDDYSLVAGLRFNRETSGYHFSSGSPPPAIYVPKASYSSTGNTENAITGKLGLQHRFSNSLMGYVMGSTGYKGLAYDLTSGLNATVAAQQPVKSETAKTLEAGLKGNFFDNRLTLNIAAFTTRFSNYQQNSGGYLPGTTTYVTRLNSIDGVQTHGLELDVAAAPVRNLTLNGSIAYTEATITSFPNGPCYNVPGSPNGGFNAECRRRDPNYGNQNVQDLSGARMPNAPLIKLNIGGQYDLRWKESPLDGFITANYRYQSKVLTNLNQDPSLEVPAFGIFNLGFGVADKQRKYKLSMFVNNVFDRHYALTGFNGLANWSVTPPIPSATATTATWTPARDAFRYFGVRFDAEF